MGLPTDQPGDDPRGLIALFWQEAVAGLRTANTRLLNEHARTQRRLGPSAYGASTFGIAGVADDAIAQVVHEAVAAADFPGELRWESSCTRTPALSCDLTLHVERGSRIPWAAVEVRKWTSSDGGELLADREKLEAGFEPDVRKFQLVVWVEPLGWLDSALGELRAPPDDSGGSWLPFLLASRDGRGRGLGYRLAPGTRPAVMACSENRWPDAVGRRDALTLVALLET